MNYQQIFNEYYALYRAEAEAPTSDDEEFQVGISLANEAISRWESYDNTMWRELFTSLSLGNQTIPITDAVEYSLPANYRNAGSSLEVVDDDGAVLKRYALKEPHEQQFLGGHGTYFYIIGNPSGYRIRLSNTPEDSIQGKRFNLLYYRQAARITSGSSRPEMKNPRFIVHRMLAQRFRASRNWTGYQTANRDAEDALRTMQLENNSGSWANPWQVKDTSGTTWGA